VNVRLLMKYFLLRYTMRPVCHLVAEPHKVELCARIKQAS